VVERGDIYAAQVFLKIILFRNVSKDIPAISFFVHAMHIAAPMFTRSA